MRRLPVVATILGVLVGLGIAGPGRSVTIQDWPSYLFGSSHPSATPDAQITGSNAGTLHRVWTHSGHYYASPTVYQGVVYVGADNGSFTALRLDTGAVIWQRNTGVQKGTTCGTRGTVSTAAVAPAPVSGTLTVYVAGADGYLYALRASDGAVMWRSVVGALPSSTVNDYFNWTSPTLMNGRIYVGVSSNCDHPFVRGGLQSFDQSTGKLLGSWWGVPSGAIGGGVWTSAAATPDGNVWITTASGPKPPAPQGDSYSLVRLNGATMAKADIWAVPQAERGYDADFGASPVLFSANLGGIATRMVGACNKNGWWYALRAGALATGPVWKVQVGSPAGGDGRLACLAAAIWDGSRLFVAGNATTVNGVAAKGAIRRLNPANGAAVWQLALGGNILGSPTINGAGLIAASTFDFTSGATNTTYLIDAATGRVVKTISVSNSPEFSQPVFAGKYLLLATTRQGINAYTP